MAKIIDLSLPTKRHWRWLSGSFRSRSHEEGDIFRHTMLVLSVHGFTHVDAPAHFVPGGATIDQLPIDAYCGEAAVVDLTHVGPEQGVSAADLERCGQHAHAGDIVLLRTDWPRKSDWESMDFWATAPYITEDACRWLIERKVKAVGADFPADYVLRYEVTDRRHHAERQENTSHFFLLSSGIGLLEYLTNLHLISKPRVQVYALPIKIEGSDGSPVRAVAVEGD